MLMKSLKMFSSIHELSFDFVDYFLSGEKTFSCDIILFVYFTFIVSLRGLI